MYKEIEAELGYAKIEGPELHEIITKTKVILGRDVKHSDEQTDSSEQIIRLGQNLKISRRHLLFYFDEKKKEWYAENLSKNTVLVNRKPFSKSDPPKCISPISAIKIDDVQFYFFQSRDEIE